MVGDADQTAETIPDDDDGLPLPMDDSSTEIRGPKWIGNIRCFWHDTKGRPRLTIGPNWGFTIVLAIMVAGILHVSISGMIGLVKNDAAWYYQLVGVLIIFFGLAMFFMTLLGDPGIPDEIYHMRARPYAQAPMLPLVDAAGFKLCSECNVHFNREREHCELCNVCID